MLDGGIGSLLAAAGREASHESLLDAHRQFIEAGAQAITAHTFAIDAVSVPDHEERHERLRGAVRAARQAAAGNVPVLASLGPFSAIVDGVAGTASHDLVSEVTAVVREAGVEGIILRDLSRSNWPRRLWLACRPWRQPCQ